MPRVTSLREAAQSEQTFLQLNELLRLSEAENAALKAELKAINAALDDPITDLTMTACEVISTLKEQVAQLERTPEIESDEYKTWWELALHVGAWKDHELDYVHFGSEMAVRAFAIHLLRQRDKFEAEQQQTITTLQSKSAALVNALEGLLSLDEENHQRYPGDEDVCLEVRNARAALAAFKGEK